MSKQQYPIVVYKPPLLYFRHSNKFDPFIIQNILKGGINNHGNRLFKIW